MKEEHRAVIERDRHRRELLAGTCRALFLQHNPEVLEIGCGHGHFLAAYAAAHPTQCCAGIDLITKRLQKSDRKREKRDLNNLHFLKAEGREFIDALDPTIRLNRIFILFPDPWPKKRHHKRRLIQEDFLSALGAHTSLGANIYFRTDFQPYYEWTSEKIECSPNWALDEKGCWPFEEESYFEQILGEHQSLIARRI
jgi:tRNA (guanine-N7-)-methyltransferase